ncbi:hypothetical protein ACFFUB_04335 [Algimonas porphyrae]|uniref:Uncharacterized protein n=1 Tax=Algimonas porphyrae TaxID=1128113 RepID=A0ABQ5V056_9PROT|nr:hypothetical protein [Algimonas porphyrae]GLQ20001.1 hypothetical protein GCM10007854_09560 [Algimonas porphyrae]
MLLRRVKVHVQDQNWFAVGIDFCIVVIGVFMGLQVQQWNEARKETALEAAYVERLHKEVVDLEDIRRDLIAEREVNATVLHNAVNRLWDAESDPLTQDECASVSTILPTTNPTDDLPLIIELLSSGRITIFNNERLETALAAYLIARSRARDSREGVSRTMPQPSLEHSDLFEIRQSLSDFIMDENSGTAPDEAARIYGSYIVCDEDAMRSNVMFKNDLSNMELQYAYHILDNRSVSVALADLHEALDLLLDIDHQEQTP